MADEKNPPDEESLYEKARRLRRAGPHETPVQADYKDRLIANSRKTHLGEGSGATELSSAEKNRAAAVSKRPPPVVDLPEESVADKAYKARMVALAESKLKS